MMMVMLTKIYHKSNSLSELGTLAINLNEGEHVISYILCFSKH